MPAPAPTRVTLEADVAAQLCEHARAAWPEECCGALFGTDGAVRGARALSNAAADRRRGFLVSARDYLAAEAEAEARGERLVGFYHSHPDGVATPSPADADAAWACFVTLIVPVSARRAGAPRAFRFDPAKPAFEEVPLHATDPHPRLAPPVDRPAQDGRGRRGDGG